MLKIEWIDGKRYAADTGEDIEVLFNENYMNWGMAYGITQMVGGDRTRLPQTGWAGDVYELAAITGCSIAEISSAVRFSETVLVEGDVYFWWNC